MPELFLNTESDLAWLRDVHLQDLSAPVHRSAILVGNEDAPARIELYAEREPAFDASPVAVFVDDARADTHTLIPDPPRKGERMDKFYGITFWGRKVTFTRLDALAWRRYQPSALESLWWILVLRREVPRTVANVHGREIFLYWTHSDFAEAVNA